MPPTLTDPLPSCAELQPKAFHYMNMLLDDGNWW